MKEKALYGEFFKADFFYINYKSGDNITPVYFKYWLLTGRKD